jgi:hypothetical protein
VRKCAARPPSRAAIGGTAAGLTKLPRRAYACDRPRARACAPATMPAGRSHRSPRSPRRKTSPWCPASSRAAASSNLIRGALHCAISWRRSSRRRAARCSTAPYGLWEHPPPLGKLPPNGSDSGSYLVGEVFTARSKDVDGLNTADQKYPSRDRLRRSDPRRGSHRRAASDLARGFGPRACRRGRSRRPWRQRWAYLLAQLLAAGGFCVSSIAQKGIDHTKSAEVAICCSPGMPSKIGGEAV